MSTLYMIPAPLGDTLDAATAANGPLIASLDYFVVEELRTARRFLSSLGQGSRIDSLHFAELNEHTRPEELAVLLKPLLDGHDMGMISEAGLPGIADPGATLAAACHERGIRVVPLVGGCSITLALMASGQNGQSFAFNGYLPVKPPERTQAIRNFERRARAEGQAQLFIEAPYRNDKLLEDILSVCDPATRVTVAVDLLNPGESVITRSVASWRTSPRPQLHKRPAIFIIGR